MWNNEEEQDNTSEYHNPIVEGGRQHLRPPPPPPPPSQSLQRPPPPQSPPPQLPTDSTSNVTPSAPSPLPQAQIVSHQEMEMEMQIRTYAVPDDEPDGRDFIAEKRLTNRNKPTSLPASTVAEDQPIPATSSSTLRSVEYQKKLNEQPVGLLDYTSSLCETPEDAVKRILMNGEVILADFDCYFPYEMLPMWKLIYLCIITCGLYALILCYRVIRRACYRMRCCTPKTLSFIRGKMMVTNYGRLICWAEKGKQRKLDGWCCFNWLCCLCRMICSKTCAPSTTYQVQITTVVQTVSSIREISQFYESKANCLCCCSDFYGGLKVSFNEFDHHGKTLDSYVQTVATDQYIGLLISGKMIDKVASYFEKLIYVTSTDCVYLCANSQEMMHINDSQAMLDDIAALHERFLSTLPKMPEIVVENPELDANRLFNTTDNFANVTIVGNDGSVTIPKRWIPLMTGEKVIASVGQVFTMRWKDWILNILSLGLYYCLCIRNKKYLRSALVLTNKRLIVLDIYERSGTIPLTLTNFAVQITSYFPEEIFSGYLTSGSKAWMQVGLGTPGGGIIMEFYNRKRSLPFAKAVQLATSRLEQSLSLPEDKPREIPHLNAEDLKLFPLFANEQLEDGFSGAFSFEPFCPSDRGCGKVCFSACCPWCKNPKIPLISSKTLGKVCFPWGLHFCTCALRPFQQYRDMYVSGNTFFQLSRSGNFGLCSFMLRKKTPCVNGPCSKRDAYVLSWVSIASVQGHALTVQSKGEETILRRCCKGNCCGRICCPISYNEFNLEVATNKGANFSIMSVKKNHNFSKDPKLRNMVSVLDIIEKNNYHNKMHR